MTDSSHEELAALIKRMSARERLQLRCALVRQAVHFAAMLLREGRNSAERGCLEAVARWLEQPEDDASQQAILAALEQGDQLEQDQEQLEERGVFLHYCVWDAARATQVPLPEAARLAADAACGAATALCPPGNWEEVQRWRRVATRRASVSARQWQLAAARATLAGDEPPPLPALPEPLSDPAEILAAYRIQTDARRIYERGDLEELRLLLSRDEERERHRLQEEQRKRCIRAVRPPPEEGELPWMWSGLLRDAVAGLVCAQVRRRQASLAQAVASGGLLPAAPDETGPLGGRLAAYLTGDLAQLCASLDAAGLLRLKQALVEQALVYALQALPGPAGDRGHLESLMAVEQWLNEPSGAPPSDHLGPVPAGTSLPSARAWRAVRGVTEAARAPGVPALLEALNRTIANATAAKMGTVETSREAMIAVWRAKDYQLAAAFQIGRSLPPPTWLGPEPTYSPRSFDALIWQMSEHQHGLLRWGLIHDARAVVERGLEASVQSREPLAAALRAWAAHPRAGIRGATLVPDPAVEAACRADPTAVDRISKWLASALHVATRQETAPEGRAFATRAVAEECEKAARLAAYAIAERWQLDMAYALLSGADPPSLAV